MSLALRKIVKGFESCNCKVPFGIYSGIHLLGVAKNEPHTIFKITMRTESKKVNVFLRDESINGNSGIFTSFVYQKMHDAVPLRPFLSLTREIYSSIVDIDHVPAYDDGLIKAVC